jgi:hypothetical protein
MDSWGFFFGYHLVNLVSGAHAKIPMHGTFLIWLSYDVLKF